MPERSPWPSQTNGVIERLFGTLKYEHLYRAPIDKGGVLAVETARFRDIYTTAPSAREADPRATSVQDRRSPA